MKKLVIILAATAVMILCVACPSGRKSNQSVETTFVNDTLKSVTDSLDVVKADSIKVAQPAE